MRADAVLAALDDVASVTRPRAHAQHDREAICRPVPVRRAARALPRARRAAIPERFIPTPTSRAGPAVPGASPGPCAEVNRRSGGGQRLRRPVRLGLRLSPQALQGDDRAATWQRVTAVAAQVEAATDRRGGA